jgi:Tubulin-tyrosine ligase family
MNLSRKQKQFPKQYDFVPLTFCLKYDYELFQNFKMKRPYWIIKPVDAARGEGIRVIPRTETIKQSPSKFD